MKPFSNPGYPPFVQAAASSLGLDFVLAKTGLAGGALRECSRMVSEAAQPAFDDLQRSQIVAQAKKYRNSIAVELHAADRMISALEDALGLTPPAAPADEAPAARKAAKAKPES